MDLLIILCVAAILLRLGSLFLCKVLTMIEEHEDVINSEDK